MTLAFWFWLVFVLSFIFSGWRNWRSTGNFNAFGPLFLGDIFLFLLILFLGLEVFKDPLGTLVK